MKNWSLLLMLHCWLLSYAKGPVVYSVPMQGHTTYTGMSLWLMVPQGSNYTYSLLASGTGSPIAGEADMSPENCWHKMCPVTLHFSGLTPGSGYRLSIYSREDSLVFSRKYHTLQTPDPNLPANFSVIAGSCFLRGTGGLTELVDNHAADPIYKSLMADTSDLMLWLGDNLYYLYEYRAERGMLRKNVETRLLPEMQGLLGDKMHFSIWDDHEFGPNDSDGSFPKKDISARIFRAFWPNPPAAEENNTNYYKFAYEDAEFFMLDDRYLSKRSPTPGIHSIIDSLQMSWLKEDLLHSTATFKVLCLGSQWFHDKRQGSKDIFQGSEGSEAFLQFIKNEHISGLLLISGDVHYGMLQEIPREGTYPLHELTSSAVSSWPNDGPLKSPGSVSSYLVPGTLYTGNNYSVLGFSGNPGKRLLTIRTYNVDGIVVWEHSIREDELK